MSKVFLDQTGKYQIKRLSRWIKIRTNYNVGKNNRLYDFATDENGVHTYQDHCDPSNGLYLDYFRFDGRNYALESFYRLGTMWLSGAPYQYTDQDGDHFIGALYTDGADYFSPGLYMEMDEYGEYVRLYHIDPVA